MGAGRRHLAESVAAFKGALANPDLRRLQLAWAGSVVGHWAYLVAVSVYAYRAGGEAAVGILFLLRLLPAALFSPLASLLADRFPRRAGMVASDLARVALVGGAAAAVFLGSPRRRCTPWPWPPSWP